MTTLPAMHRLWLNEVRNAFRPASLAGATVWDRAKAVTYLRERFVPRFRAERQAAANLVALLHPEKEEPLRAAGDMVEARSTSWRGSPRFTRRRSNSGMPPMT